MKVTEMPVVSLKGVNCRFWSHVRCSGQKANIFTHTGIAQVDYERKLKIYENRMTMLLKSNNRIQHSM